MNVLISFALYLGLFFVMIALALLNILPVNYLGGIVVALFIAGLCYAWLNAWCQTSKQFPESGSSKANSTIESQKRNQRKAEEDTKKKPEMAIPAA